MEVSFLVLRLINEYDGELWEDDCPSISVIQVAPSGSRM